MKISIWQQFSSNHSADFTLVGQFESSEWAKTVAEEIRHIIHSIGWWWEQVRDDETPAETLNRLLEQYNDASDVPPFVHSPDVLTHVYTADSRGPTPPEIYYQQQYGLQKWGRCGTIPLDWIRGRYAERVVEVYNDLVIVSPMGNTWAGAHPFDTILEQLGGRVAASLEGYVGLGLNIDCTAPSAAAADAIVKKMVMFDPDTHTRWSIIDGLQRSYFYPETDIAAVDEKITIRKLNLPYFTTGGDGHADRSNRLSVDEGLQHVITHLTKRNCTDIQYSFSQVGL